MVRLGVEKRRENCGKNEIKLEEKKKRASGNEDSIDNKHASVVKRRHCRERRQSLGRVGYFRVRLFIGGKLVHTSLENQKYEAINRVMINTKSVIDANKPEFCLKRAVC
jgi:hypothetical protein